MKIVRIHRFGYMPWGTFGQMVLDAFAWFTVEPPWRGNKRNVSCIPAGRYPLRPAIHHISTPDSTDDYPVYEICDVPGRGAIHLHIGNRIADSLGCPLIGTKLYDDRSGVANSTAAHAQFMTAMADVPEARIVVLDHFPYRWEEEELSRWQSQS